MAPIMFIVDGTCEERIMEDGEEIGQLVKSVCLSYLFGLDKVVTDKVTFYQVLKIFRQMSVVFLPDRLYQSGYLFGRRTIQDTADTE